MSCVFVNLFVRTFLRRGEESLSFFLSPPFIPFPHTWTVFPFFVPPPPPTAQPSPAASHGRIFVVFRGGRKEGRSSRVASCPLAEGGREAEAAAPGEQKRKPGRERNHDRDRRGRSVGRLLGVRGGKRLKLMWAKRVSPHFHRMRNEVRGGKSNIMPPANFDIPIRVTNKDSLPDMVGLFSRVFRLDDGGACCDAK